MVDGLRQSTTSWYYLFGAIGIPSYSWTRAEQFRDFCFYRNDRATFVHPRELVAGDILQVKWNAPNNPGYHSMVIVGVDSHGNPRYNQHSPNRTYYSFADLAHQYPNAIWYGWHLTVPGEINITRINPNPLRISQNQGNGYWLTVTGSNFKTGVKARVNQWQIASSGVRLINQSAVKVWVAMNNVGGMYTLLLQYRWNIC